MADGVELASGYLSLTVKYADAQKQIAADFAGIKKQAGTAGDDAGEAMSDALVGSVSKGAKKAGEQMSKQLIGATPAMAKTLAKELGDAGDKASKEMLRQLASGNEAARRNAATVGRQYAAALQQSMRGGGSDAAKKWEAEFRNALDARDSSQIFFDEFHRDAVARGEKVGTAVGKAVAFSIRSAITLGAAGAATAVAGIGYTLTQGFKRLEKIDNARFKLQALGNSATDVDEIMKNAQQSVKGTAFALDEAASSAASAVAAGIKPGKQLTTYLTSVADTAAVAGTSFGDMASIFNKVTTNNKAYTDDLQMLADRGIPIFQYLRDEYHVSAEDLQKMVEDGKVSAADFETALDTHIGGAAQKMGQSFSGAVDNMQTAAARVGANFLASVFGGSQTDALAGPTEAVGALTKKLDEANAWIGAHGKEIHDFFVDAKNVGKEFADAIGPPLKAAVDALREHPDLIKAVVGAFVAWKTIDGVASLVGNLKTISSLLRVTLPADAAAGAAGISTALGAVVIPPVIAELIDPGSVTNMGPDRFNPDKSSRYSDGNSQGWGSVLFGPKVGSYLDNLGKNGDSGVPQGPLPGGAPALPGIIGGQGGSNAPSGGDALSPGFILGPGASASPAAGPGSPLLDMLGPGGGAGPGGGPTAAGIPKGLIATPTTYSPQGGAEQWRPLVQQQLAIYGPQFGITNSKAWEDAIIRQIGSESSGNPTAWNKTDSNAAKGIPSKGLLQFIEPTFNANNISGGSWLDPAAQIAAVIPYVVKTYGIGPDGSPNRIGRGHNYVDGGAVFGAGSRTSDSIPANLSRKEHVFTADDVDAMGGQSNVYAFRAALHRKGFAGVRPGSREIWRGPDKRIKSLGFADGGAPEDALLKLLQGRMDPNSTQHGQSQGAPVGPTPDELQQAGAQIGPNQGQGDGQAPESGRTEGYIPAGAGSGSVAGTSFLSGIYNMGAEVINGVIDQAASAASTAASVGVTAVAPGAGGAAGAGVSAAIGLGTQAAKRGVQYGAQMLGIGTDAIIEQLTPFGAPRLLSTDPMSFVPQQQIMQAATTSIEKAFQNGQGPGASGEQPGAGNQGQSPPATPFGPAAAPLPGPTHGPEQAGPALGPPPGPSPLAPPQQPANGNDFNFLKTMGVYDQGGWLPPNGVAINKTRSREPMPVFNDDQWGTLNALANTETPEFDPKSSGGNDYRTVIENVTVKDVAELERKLSDRSKLQSMRHRGRP